MSSSSETDDVIFVKEEIKVKYTGPFPVPKPNDGQKKDIDFYKCLQEKLHTSTTQPTSTGKYLNISTYYKY